jgi:hypothetical protein
MVFDKIEMVSGLIFGITVSPINVLRKYLFFPIYLVAFIDVLIDIEKYSEY